MILNQIDNISKYFNLFFAGAGFKSEIEIF